MIYVCPEKDCIVREPCKPCICGMDTLKAFGGTKDPKPRVDPPRAAAAVEAIEKMKGDADANK